MKRRKRLLVTLTISMIVSVKVIAQTQVFAANQYQTFSSTGTTNGAASDGANLRLYSSLGQPMAWNVALTTTPHTQAGILSAYSTGFFVSDNIPPTITTSSPPASFKSGDTFATTVTDNVTVSGAAIHFKTITSSPTAGLDSLSLTAGASNAYTLAIQNSTKTLYDAMGIEYYYTAHDAKGNYKRDPLTGYYFSYQASSGVQMPATVLSSGTSTINFRIIAMPYSSVGGDAITSVFGANSGLPSITDTNGANWKLGHYDNSPGIDSVQAYPDHLSVFKRGLGYWFITRNPATINIGQVTAPTNNRSSLFQLPLTDGWNMIGNPYPVDISWADVQNLPGNPSVGALNVWTGGWSTATTLSAFQGGFVKNTGSATIKIPFQGQKAEGSRISSTISNSDISDDQWKVDLHINQDDTFNKLGGFGMTKTGSSGEDEFDSYNPPSLFDSPEINFVAGDPKDKMCSSIVGLNTEYVWKFSPAGIAGKPMQLEWSSDLGGGQEQLYLVDELQARVIDMRQQSNYSFVLQRNQPFSIYFGKDALQEIAASQLVISSPYPNPAVQKQTTFNLGLPDSGSSYSVNVQIYNNSGMLVSNQSFDFAPGIKSVAWQPNEIGSGMYFYRVSVNSKIENAVSTGKITVP